MVQARIRRLSTLLAGFALVAVLGSGGADAGAWAGHGWIKQVFPPRSSSPPPSAPTSPSDALPNSLVKAVPFATLLGDFTKSFVQIANLGSPMDSNFVLGRGLIGRLNLERHIHEAGNGNKVYLHVNGTSNPPLVSTEGNELHLRFLLPAILFKSYYKDYTNESDLALGDVVAEKATVDIYLTPLTDQRRLPTYQTVRVVFAGELKEPAKCTYWFDVIFPVNVCSLVKDYLKNIKLTVENGVREALQQPQTRMQFDQAVWQQLRGELLQHAGLNPASRAQVQIVEASFRGTDYVVTYLPRP
jgi:hypothetical protein